MVKLDREKNINTVEWWNKLHGDGKEHNSKISQQFDRFFELGFLPTNKKITLLDVGCGHALHFRDLEKKYPLVEWCGLDFSSAAIERSERTAPHGTYYTANIEEDKLEGIFDYVVSMHTFEHFDNPVEVLGKCIAAAREKVIINVPYGDAWNSEGSHMHKFTLDDPFTNYVDHKIINKNLEISYVFNGEAK